MTLVASLFVFNNEVLCNGEHELARLYFPIKFSVNIASDERDFRPNWDMGKSVGELSGLLHCHR
jgi:hypothetical protein